VTLRTLERGLRDEDGGVTDAPVATPDDVFVEDATRPDVPRSTATTAESCANLIIYC
jgi:hypothetical protein